MLLLTIYIQFRKCLGRLASKTRLRQAFQKQNSDVRFLFLHASAWSYTFYWISMTRRHFFGLDSDQGSKQQRSDISYEGPHVLNIEYALGPTHI